MPDSSASLRTATIDGLERDLRQLGVESGDAIMVHASLRSVGATENRGQGLIAALLRAVGPHGTLMAYADFHPTQEIPFFDPKRSPARPDYGVFAELVRTWPGAARSDNPGASMVAVGARAEWLCENHPNCFGYGPDGPLGKFADVGGKVILLGSDPDQVTILHLAEHLARVPNKRIVQRTVDVVQPQGGVKSITLEEFDTSNPVVTAMPAKFFESVVTNFINSGAAKIGRVGKAQAFLLPAKALVSTAVARIEREYGAEAR